MGGKHAVAGRPSRIAATGLICLRSMTALVKWVVPIMTFEILSRSTFVRDRTCSSASSTPDVTSSVVAAFTPSST